jgi:TPR repeat protein
LDEDGKVIEKVVSNGKDHFVFEKLPQANYTFLIHNKPDNLQAEIRLVEDEPLIVKEAPVVPEAPVVKEIPGEAEYKEGMHEYYKLNFTKALSHFHDAEKKENPNVFFLLGRLYDSGEGVAINNEMAFHFYEKGVAHGDPKANAGLALLYLEGKGVHPDTVKANALFHKALPAIIEKANEGDLFWMTRLGTLYNFGFGVKEDYKEAAKWYSKAADRGYAFAQFNLGVMYENGLGVKQDYAVALKLYQKAVEQGDVDAEFKMGVMYANGFGVERNYTEALKWYTKAASYGYADAQYNIGVLYANGLGVDKNFEEAIKWYKKAADQGFPDAEYNLAVMYAKGQGVKKDNEEAVRWYKLAAKKGVEEAQKLLRKKGVEW